MNELNASIDTEVAGLQSPFFRAADRLRLEGFVLALTQEGMSLSLVSTHEAILDHYGKLLVERLRTAAPDAQLEVYFPANSEALLARFNEALANSSVQDAMQGSSRTAPARIWIVHDAGALPDHEIQLLARLVQHFPGANIRVVLLLTAASQKQKLLDSFGRRIQCWDIEPPTPEQADLLLQRARAEGREGAVRALLQKIAPPLMTAPSVRAPVEPYIKASTTLPPPKAAPLEDETHMPPKRWRWVVVAVGLLVACALLVAMFNVSSASLKQGPQIWKELLAGKTATEAMKPAATPAIAAASEPAAAAASAAPMPVVTASTPVIATTSMPMPASITEPSPPILVETPKERVVEPVVASVEKVEKSAESLVGQAWIQKMPPGTFLVQHVIATSYASALKSQQRYPALGSARIVAIYDRGIGNTVSYMVVSGPFGSLAEAANFASTKGIPKDAMVRSAKAIKTQLSPELAGDAVIKNQEFKR